MSPLKFGRKMRPISQLEQPKRQKLAYMREWLSLKPRLKHSPTRHPNFFTGMGSAKCGLEFRSQSTLRRTSFETKRPILNVKCASTRR